MLVPPTTRCPTRPRAFHQSFDSPQGFAWCVQPACLRARLPIETSSAANMSLACRVPRSICSCTVLEAQPGKRSPVAMDHSGQRPQRPSNKLSVCCDLHPYPAALWMRKRASKRRWLMGSGAKVGWSHSAGSFAVRKRVIRDTMRWGRSLKLSAIRRQLTWSDFGGYIKHDPAES